MTYFHKTQQQQNNAKQKENCWKFSSSRFLKERVEIKKIFILFFIVNLRKRFKPFERRNRRRKKITKQGLYKFYMTQLFPLQNKQQLIFVRKLKQETKTSGGNNKSNWHVAFTAVSPWYYFIFFTLFELCANLIFNPFFSWYYFLVKKHPL